MGQGSSGRSMIIAALAAHGPQAATGRGPGIGTASITAGIRAAQGSAATSWPKARANLGE